MGDISRVMCVARAALLRTSDNEAQRSVPKFINLERGATRDRVLSLEESTALFKCSQRRCSVLVFAVGDAVAVAVRAIAVTVQRERSV